MENNSQDNVAKGGGSKRPLMTVIIIAVLIVGGYFAFTMFSKSPKEQYFSAEIATKEYVEEFVKERFKPELEWLAFSGENPTETKVDISAEYNDPFGGFGEDEIAEMINNSKITMTAKGDIEKKKLATEIEADIAGMTFEDINFYITEDTLLVELPFLKDTLKITDSDLTRILKEAEPDMFAKDEEVDFGKLFDQDPFLSEEDAKYLKKEYIDMIYKDLPDDAFKAEKEEVEVNDEKIKAEKITFHLEEDKFKEILKKVFEKIEKDERLREILKEQFNTGFALDYDMDFKEFISEFDDAIADAIDGVDDIVLPDGMTSTIWVKNNLVVKRDFALTVGPDKDDLATIEIKGDQLLAEKKQHFDYEFYFEDEWDEGTFNFSGDLLEEDGKIDDKITLSFDDFDLTYEANETLKKDGREFEREFLADFGYEKGSLLWTGEATYEKDNMNSEHNLSLEIDDFSSDFFTLTLDVEGKKIKGVDIPEDSKAKDLGKMSLDELEEYFDYDVAEQFEEWMFDQMMGAGF